jgi:hypothetical protein
VRPTGAGFSGANTQKKLKSQPLSQEDCFDILVVGADRLVLIAELFGYEVTIQERLTLLQSAAIRWKTSIINSGEFTEARCFSFLKYKSAAFFASHMQQELPDSSSFPSLRDKPQFLIGGTFYRWQKLLHHQSLTHPSPVTPWLEFLVSVSSGWKKGNKFPSPWLVKQGVVKTFKSLTRLVPPPAALKLSWADSEEKQDLAIDTFQRTERLYHELIRTVYELYESSAKSYQDSVDYPQPVFPTLSSTFDSSRKLLGGLGHLRKAAIFDISSLKDNFSYVNPQPYISVLVPRRYEEYDRHFGGADVIYDDSHVRLMSHALTRRVESVALSTSPRVSLVGLSEAFKVRVISKAPTASQYALRHIQKILWSTIESNPVFTLIGEPVSELLIQSQIGVPQGGETLFSIDYSDATNSLTSAVSDQVIYALARCFLPDSPDGMISSEPERAALILSMQSMMTKHLIEDPDSQDTKPQTAGQLMGSVISFPILCIINIAICRMALEEAHGKVYNIDSRLPILINGDDGLIRAKQSFGPIWEKTAAIAGLKSSVGKTFVSTKFCQVNSVTYLLLSKEDAEISVGLPTGIAPDSKQIARRVRFKRIPFVNLGLLYGSPRSLQPEDRDKPPSLALLPALNSELIRMAPEHMSDRIGNLFLRIHRDVLQQAAGVPWFIPQYFGGLGLHGVPRDVDFEYAIYLMRVMKKIPDDKRPRTLDAEPLTRLRTFIDRKFKLNRLPNRYLSDEQHDESETVRTMMLQTLIFDKDPNVHNFFNIHNTPGGLNLIGEPEPDGKEINKDDFAEVIRFNTHFYQRHVRKACHSLENNFIPFIQYIIEEGVNAGTISERRARPSDLPLLLKDFKLPHYGPYLKLRSSLSSKRSRISPLRVASPISSSRLLAAEEDLMYQTADFGELLDTNGLPPATTLRRAEFEVDNLSSSSTYFTDRVTTESKQEPATVTAELADHTNYAGPVSKMNRSNYKKYLQESTDELRREHPEYFNFSDPKPIPTGSFQESPVAWMAAAAVGSLVGLKVLFG